jgi:tetratricopeptide (TPR) repeat protein
MRSRNSLVLVLLPALCAALLAIAPRVAFAAGGSEDEQVAQAKARFEEGRAAYLAGDYGKAIQSFQSAQDIRPSPILDYNIALCYEGLGDAQSAVVSYRSYLSQKPDASNRAEVEERIRALEAMRDQQAKPAAEPAPSTENQAEAPPASADPYTQTAPPTGQRPAAPPAQQKTRWWIPVVIVGGAILVTATIITVAVLASQTNTDPWVYEAPSTHPLSTSAIQQQPALLRF